MNSSIDDNRLLELLYGELEGEELQHVEASLSSEERDLLQSWEQIREACMLLPELEPDLQAHYSLLRASRASPKPRFSFFFSFSLKHLSLIPGAATLGLLILALGTFYLLNQEESGRGELSLDHFTAQKPPLPLPTEPPKLALKRSPKGSVKSAEFKEKSPAKQIPEAPLERVDKPALKAEAREKENLSEAKESAKVLSIEIETPALEKKLERAREPRKAGKRRRARRSPSTKAKFPKTRPQKARPKQALPVRAPEPSPKFELQPPIPPPSPPEPPILDSLPESSRVRFALPPPPSIDDGLSGKTSDSAPQVEEVLPPRNLDEIGPQAVSIESPNSSKLLRQAQRERSRGDHHSAVKSYEAFLSRYHEHPALQRVLFETAESYEALEQRERARQLYRLVQEAGGVLGDKAKERLEALQ